MSFEMPTDFAPGGQALYDALYSPDDEQSTVALIVEACRAKDRLDKLNRLTSGDEDAWCRVFAGDFEGELVLKLDTAVSEQRQLATVFRQLLSEIQRRQSERPDTSEPDGFADL